MAHSWFWRACISVVLLGAVIGGSTGAVVASEERVVPVGAGSESSDDQPADDLPTGDSTDSDSSGDNTESGETDGNRAAWFNPGEWVKDALQWFVESVTGGISELLAFFNTLLFTLPAPGSESDPTTWTAPDDPWWDSVWETYWLFALLGITAIIPAWMLVQGQPAKQRRSGYRRLVKSSVMIIGGFPIAALGLHIGHVVSYTLSPAGTEFLQTPGSTAKLGLGVALGAALLLIKSGIIVIGLFVLFLQYFLTYVVVAFWPLFWALMAMPVWAARTAGKVGVSLYVTLILVKIFQTALLRFLFELPLAGLETVMTLVSTSIGLLVATIGLPYVFAQKVLPGAVMGMSRRGQQAVDRVSPLREQYERTRQQVGERLDNTLPDSLSTPEENTGGTGYGPLPSRDQYTPSRSVSRAADTDALRTDGGSRSATAQIDQTTDRLSEIDE